MRWSEPLAISHRSRPEKALARNLQARRLSLPLQVVEEYFRIAKLFSLNRNTKKPQGLRPCGLSDGYETVEFLVLVLVLGVAVDGTTGTA